MSGGVPPAALFAKWLHDAANEGDDDEGIPREESDETFARLVPVMGVAEGPSRGVSEGAGKSAISGIVKKARTGGVVWPSFRFA